MTHIHLGSVLRLMAAMTTATLYVDNARADAPLFAPVLHYEAGEWPISVAIADMDLDGALDVVTANRRSRDITVMRGAGDGSLRPPAQWATLEGTPVTSVLEDLDRDGRIDALVVTSLPPTLVVLMNRTDGEFVREVYPLANFPGGLSVGDLNGDHVPDAVAVVGGKGDILVFRGIGNGRFEPGEIVGHTGCESNSVRLADFDADTITDLAVLGLHCGRTAGAICTRVFLWRGNALTTLGTRQDLREVYCGGYGGAETGSIRFGHLNPDSLLDLAVGVSGRDGGNLQVFAQNSDGQFPRTALLQSGRLPDVLIDDLQSDGASDLIAVDSDKRGLTVFRGAADGTFAEGEDFPGWPSAHYLAGAAAHGDLNGDAYVDVVVANVKGNDVAIFLGNGAIPITPTATYTPTVTRTPSPVPPPTQPPAPTCTASPTPIQPISAFQISVSPRPARSGEVVYASARIIGDNPNPWHFRWALFSAGTNNKPIPIRVPELPSDSRAILFIAPPVSNVVDLVLFFSADDSRTTTIRYPKVQVLPCESDCNGDGVVTINETMTAVAGLLDPMQVVACGPADADRSGGLSISDITAGIASLLEGCGRSRTDEE